MRRESAPTSGRVLSVLTLLLLVLFVWLSAASVTAEAAAPVVGASSKTPSWRVGDVVPLTVYVRLARQVRRDTWFFGRSHDVEDDVVEPGENDGFGSRKEALEARRKDLQGALEELQVDEDGLVENLVPEVTSGKHHFQVVRTLPPGVGPRFAQDKVATLRMHHWHTEAALQIASDGVTAAAPLQSELALRISLGRGLKKETTWLPLAVRRRKLPTMAHVLMMPSDMTGRTTSPAESDARTPARPSDDEVLFLTALQFEFGFQTGATNTITNYGVKAHYRHIPKYARLSNASRADAEKWLALDSATGDKAHVNTQDLQDVVMLRYNWHEHRAFNPARAMTLCSGAALIGALVVVSITFSSRSTTSKQFRRRAVAVRTRDD